MKKFACVCLLALPLLALDHQQASAWFRFNLGGSFNTSLEGNCLGGKNLSINCQSAPCYPGCGYPMPYAPAPGAAPAPRPVEPPKVKPASHFVPASYWFQDEE